MKIRPWKESYLIDMDNKDAFDLRHFNCMSNGMPLPFGRANQVMCWTLPAERVMGLSSYCKVKNLRKARLLR